jgi:hypothetical protein
MHNNPNKEPPSKEHETSESLILRNMEIKSLLQEIRNILQTEDSTITITTDGGVFDYNGTYGVVIHYKGDIIAMNLGKLYGPDLYESSYRPEIYALLTGLVMFRKLLTIIECNKSLTKIAINMDNKSLLTRINSHREFRMTVNDYRNADVDIELQVLEEIRWIEKKTE